METLRSAGLCAVLFALALQVGCEPGLPQQTGETLGYARSPDWTQRQNWPENGRRYFVGRALADHPLDEGNALDAALDHAIQNIAKTAGSAVKTQSRWAVRQQGDPGFGATSQEYNRQVTGELNVDGAVVNVQQDKVYWDRIKVKLVPPAYQYRYFVLVSVADEDYQQILLKKN